MMLIGDWLFVINLGGRLNLQELAVNSDIVSIIIPFETNDFVVLGVRRVSTGSIW
jgi:hypothetical protein